MKFRTEITIRPLSRKISHEDVILAIGSCFTGNMGTYLHDHLFDIVVNPFGVVYNPISISQSLHALLDKERYTPGDLNFHNELWFSFDHYTKFSGTDQNSTLQQINETFFHAKGKLDKASVLLLTPGTSYIYTHKASGRVVSNCHRVPEQEFERRMLTPEETCTHFRPLLKRLQDKLPAIQVIFTVSPVRHLKDGFEGNQRSKASLLLAVAKLVEEFPGMCHYFPAYEIMMDDLRDYRYYADDLLHPSDRAISYIRDAFSKYAFGEETGRLCDEIGQVRKALLHLPMHSDTKAYADFTESTRAKMRKLRNDFPSLCWENLPDFP